MKPVLRAPSAARPIRAGPPPPSHGFSSLSGDRLKKEGHRNDTEQRFVWDCRPVRRAFCRILTVAAVITMALTMANGAQA